MSLSTWNGLFYWICTSCGCCHSVAEPCPTLCDPVDCSTPDFPALRYSLELAQTHVHRVGGAIQPSRPLSSPFPPAFSLSRCQGLFQWVSSSHQVAKGLELQLQLKAVCTRLCGKCGHCVIPILLMGGVSCREARAPPQAVTPPIPLGRLECCYQSPVPGHLTTSSPSSAG